MLKRCLFLAYGIVSYAIFFATFLYAVGFVAGLGVSKGIDSGRNDSLTEALLIDAGLLMVFALQHSMMARPWFKRWSTRLVPAPIERSTYVLAASLALDLMFWQWRPLAGIIWELTDPVAVLAVRIVGIGGWLTVLLSTFMIDHFDLFGLRQVYTYFIGHPFQEHGFRTPALYKYVRHPIYMGFIVAFWATPSMSVAHLVFALATTAYILVAIQLEERDLVRTHGKRYERYREQVPMLVPKARGVAAGDSSSATA